MTYLKQCIIAVSVWLIGSDFQQLSAQNRSYTVDSLTTLIDGTQPPYNQLLPGDTLLFEHGTREFILLRNLQGEADKPLIIMNSGGIVRINTDHYYGMSIRNCRYFKLTGTGDSNYFYGFKIDRVANGGGIGLGEQSSDFEIDHISIENCKGVGISAKTDPDCSFTATRDKFTQFNTIIHDNYIEGVSFEGMYIGSTKYFGQTVHCGDQDTLLLPSLLDGVRIYNNIIKHTGWDGIQVSSASSNCQIFDNLVMYDSKDEYTYQMSGILLGGGSKCDCYNNYIGQGKGNGIENHGLGGNRIFNNIIVDAGRTYLPLDSSQMRHGIFVSDVSMQTDSSLYILNNDIINPKSDGIRFSSTHSRNNLLASNLIINPGNYDYYENGNTSFNGEDSYIMITNHSIDVTMTNNYLARSTANIGLSDNDFTLLPGSPLIDSGYFDTKGIDFDFYHNARPYGIASDIGAFEFNPESLTIPAIIKDVDAKPSLFPNPVQTWFNLKFQCETHKEISFGIYNLQGKRLFILNRYSEKTVENEIRVNVDFLSSGIYIYQLSSGQDTFSGKFIKVN